MASAQSGVWGIDVGQCGVKAIRLENGSDDELTATAFDYIEYPKILTQPDADPDQLIREALEQFLARNDIKGDMVVIAVPGQSGLARFVKLPPVEERKIADIVRFEAKQQIPFPLEEVVWDYQKLGSGEVSDGFAMGTEIGLFALKRDMVFRYLQHFKDVGVEVQIVQMAPLALCNFVAYDLIAQDRKKGGEAEDEDEDAAGEEAGKKNCVVALDIGTDNSNLIITDGDCIIWQRPIPLGGNHFTRALTKDMKLTFAKAEHLKRNAVKSPDLRKILSSLKTVLNDFVGEVQRSLGYFTNTHRDAKVQYMIGLGNAFRLPGLQKYLQEKLQLEVRKFTKLARCEGEEVTAAPTFMENLPSFAVAYGLALQGMNKTRLTTNLLPHEVHMERLIRGKKPWAVAAAACLLIVLGGLSFARAVEKNAVTNPDLTAAMADVDKTIKDRDDLINRHKTAQAELDATKNDLTRLAAGVDERWNWQLLHEYINLALPQPNGTRLFDLSREGISPKTLYFNNEAKEAFRLLEEKRLSEKNDDADDAKIKDDKIKKHLVQVNIEAISVRFSDDLLPYYRNLTKDRDHELLGMDPVEKAKLLEVGSGTVPPGQVATWGWVVEIRGYTYHKDTLQFVKTTFVENLNHFKKLVDLPENKAILDRPFQPGVTDKTLRALMTERIENKKSMLLLYKLEKDERPSPGIFKWISGSSLPGLLEGGGGAVVPGPAPKGPPGGVPGGAPSGAPPGPAGKNRSGWIGLGSDQVKAAGGPVAVGPAGGEPADIIRTEFVVLFVWQEPYLNHPQPGAPGQPVAGATPQAPPPAPPQKQ